MSNRNREKVCDMLTPLARFTRSSSSSAGGQPVPVYARETDRRNILAPSRESLWSLYTAWLRYHYMQLRWDVERGLARLLRRRWS